MECTIVLLRVVSTVLEGMNDGTKKAIILHLRYTVCTRREDRTSYLKLKWLFLCKPKCICGNFGLYRFQTKKSKGCVSHRASNTAWGFWDLQSRKAIVLSSGCRCVCSKSVCLIHKHPPWSVCVFSVNNMQLM